LAPPSPPQDRSHSESLGGADAAQQRWLFRPREESLMEMLLGRFVREEDAQDLVEYALLAALISMAGIVAMSALGSAISVHYGVIMDGAVTNAGS
jgi:Flp pilus assembly pilin Flp